MNQSRHSTNSDPGFHAAANGTEGVRPDFAASPGGLRSRIKVERAGPDTIEFVRAELHKHWHSTTIYSRGVRFEADALPAFVALDASNKNQPVGHLTYHIDMHGLEVITLAARESGLGVGTALMDRAEHEACSRGTSRLFLTTTNDNLDALRFYQRRGMCIAAVHRGMMDRYRAVGEPVPQIGKHGIPIRDEIELEITLNINQVSTGPRP